MCRVGSLDAAQLRSLAGELRSSGRAEMDALVLIVQATIRELEWEVEGLAEEAVTLRNAAAATRGLMESAVLPLDKPKEEEAVQEGAESKQEAGSEEEAPAMLPAGSSVASLDSSPALLWRQA